MLKQRVITGVILAPLVLACIFLLGPVHFSWFVALVVALGAWEWARLSGFEAQIIRVAYAAAVLVTLYASSFVAPNSILIAAVIWWCVATFFVMKFPKFSNLWQSSLARAFIGLLILVPLWTALVMLRSAESNVLVDLNPLLIILYVLVLVWVADIGAYFAGKAWGNKKLAPNVSPGKSWAGVWGGLVAVGLLAIVISLMASLSFSVLLQLVVMSLFVGVVSVIGDLTESMFKRHCGIKDSSNLLPGHGGVLDRIDSLTAAVPVFSCLLLLFQWI